MVPQKVKTIKSVKCRHRVVKM